MKLNPSRVNASGRFRRLFSNASQCWRGAFDLQAAQRSAFDGCRSSHRTLRNILCTNSDTKYSRLHGLTTVRSPSDIKAAHPLTAYDDYQPLIARMAAGEQAVLTSLPVDSFLITAGTTAEPKLIPHARNPYRSFSHHSLIQYLIFSAVGIRRVSCGRGAYLMARAATFQTSSGAPILPLSYLNFHNRYADRMYLMSSPREVFDMSDLRLSLDLHLLFALASEHLTSVSSTFLPVLLDQFFNRAALIEPLLYDAILAGTVAPIAPNLPPPDRAILDRELGGPNPRRARQVRSAIKSRSVPLVPIIWPKLRYVRCLSSASFSIGRAALKEFIGAVPIISPIYAASEAFLGFSLHPELDPSHYVIATEDAFVEFLPEPGRSSGETCLIGEVNLGGIYQIVVTTYTGLYRYRLGDRVKVVGFWGEAPVVELLGRVGQALNLFGEKTPEEALIGAVQDMATSRRVVVADFIATVKWRPARYVVYAELTCRASASAKCGLSEAFDSALRQRNPDYEDFRLDGSLDNPQIHLVPRGTVAAVVRNGKNGGGLQEKGRRILHDKPIIAMLDAVTHDSDA